MGVVTIRHAKADKSGERALMQKAHAAATHLLEDGQGPVLVVYGEETASIYFEAERAADPKTRSPRA